MVPGTRCPSADEAEQAFDVADNWCMSAQLLDANRDARNALRDVARVLAASERVGNENSTVLPGRRGR